MVESDVDGLTNCTLRVEQLDRDGGVTHIGVEGRELLPIEPRYAQLEEVVIGSEEVEVRYQDLIECHRDQRISQDVSGEAE